MNPVRGDVDEQDQDELKKGEREEPFRLTKRALKLNPVVWAVRSAHNVLT